MTVSANDAISTFITNGVTTAFTYDFPCDNSAELKVYLNNVEQVSGYTVDLTSKTVTFTSVPASGQDGVIARFTQVTQEVDYSRISNSVNLSALGAQLDKIVYRVQELDRDITRAIKVNFGIAETAVPDPESDKLLGWNTAGTELVNKTAAHLGLIEVADEDDMASNSAIKIPTQQSVKAYADTKQPLDADLTAIAALAKTDGNIIVADGSTWTVESGATARASLGLIIGTDVQAYSENLAEYAAVNPTTAGLALLDDANAAAQRTTLGLGSAAVANLLDEDNMASDSATDVPSQQSVKSYVLSHATYSVNFITQTIRVRSTGNVNLANGLENGDTLNGVTLATGDHVFLGSQTAPAENGIYTVVASGAASRATFADSAAKLAHIGFVIQGGTVGIGERWTLAMEAADITVGTTALNFSPHGIEPGYAAEVAAARGGDPSLGDRLDGLQAKTDHIDIITGDKFQFADEYGNCAVEISPERGLAMPGGLSATDAGSGTSFGYGDEQSFEARPGGIATQGLIIDKNADGSIQIGDVYGNAALVVTGDGRVFGVGTESVRPYATLLHMGALTPTSIVIAGDIEGDDLGGDVRVSVYSDESMEDDYLVTSATVDQRRTAKDASGSEYRSFKAPITGLSANTSYWARVAVNSFSTADTVLTFKTPPAQGAAASFKIVFGSCADVNRNKEAPVFDAIRLHEGDALMIFLMGDHPYADIVTDDIYLSRERVSRMFRACPAVSRLMKVMPMVSTRSDHDYAANDPHWDLEYSGVLARNIMANTRQQDRETMPMYPWANANVQAQAFWIGKFYFIVPDTYAQARYTVGDPTCLGNGTNPPGSWDQLQWFKDRILDGVAGGAQQIIGVSARGIDYETNDSWTQRYQAELTDICNFLVAEGVDNFGWWDGDMHHVGFADKTTQDFSAAGTLNIYRARSSPFLQQAYGLPTADEWGGVDATGPYPNNTSAYVVAEFFADGHIEYTAKGLPYDTETFEPTVLLGPFSTTDL